MAGSAYIIRSPAPNRRPGPRHRVKYAVQDGWLTYCGKVFKNYDAVPWNPRAEWTTRTDCVNCARTQANHAQPQLGVVVMERALWGILRVVS